MVKNLPAMQETWVWALGWEDPLERAWQPTPVFLPGESHGRRSLVGHSPQGCKESDTTERLSTSTEIVKRRDRNVCGEYGWNIYVFLFIKKFYLYLAVPGPFCCAGFSVVAVSGACSALWCTGFSSQWVLLLRSAGSRVCRLRELRLPGSEAQAQ